jgi:hypothetical protein
MGIIQSYNETEGFGVRYDEPVEGETVMCKASRLNVTVSLGFTVEVDRRFRLLPLFDFRPIFCKFNITKPKYLLEACTSEPKNPDQKL